ncbi:MAG: DUF1501 domain-containing protein [Pirellulaceae bacterium]
MIAFVHNMVGKTGVHSQATYLQATGFERPGFPGMGSWISYAAPSMKTCRRLWYCPTIVDSPATAPRTGALPFARHRTGDCHLPATRQLIDDLSAQADFVTAAGDHDGLELLQASIDATRNSVTVIRD